jgi:mono/diheme cytochrome c family protein
MIRFALIAVLLGTFSAPAQALPGDRQAGWTLARDVCAECHFVEKDDRGESWADAPAFQDVADDPAITAISLRVFLRTSHADMPNLMLSEAETDDIVAFILSLKPPR